MLSTFLTNKILNIQEVIVISDPKSIAEKASIEKDGTKNGTTMEANETWPVSLSIPEIVRICSFENIYFYYNYYFCKVNKGIYGSKIAVDNDLWDDIIKRYSDVRTKIFRLEKSWQKWDAPRN